MIRAIVLAGGEGRRFGGPKQLVRVAGKPLFLHAVKRLLAMREIGEVRVVAPPALERRFAAALRPLPVVLVPGGRTRLQSVKNGVRGLPAEGLVVLQNAASPNTPAALVRKCIRAARRTGAATAFVPAAHTVFRRRGRELEETLPRDELGYTCDPQVFSTALLLEALAGTRGDHPTVELARRRGATVALVESDASNRKVTTPGDLEAVRKDLGRRS